jgi:hypothetical protein
MGIEPDGSFEQRARDDAAKRGWTYEKIAGDISMIQRLVNGEWNPKEFLVVPPRHRVVASYDDEVIKAVPSDEEGSPESGVRSPES